MEPNPTVLQALEQYKKISSQLTGLKTNSETPPFWCYPGSKDVAGNIKNYDDPLQSSQGINPFSSRGKSPKK